MRPLPTNRSAPQRAKEIARRVRGGETVVYFATDPLSRDRARSIVDLLAEMNTVRATMLHEHTSRPTLVAWPPDEEMPDVPAWEKTTHRKGTTKGERSKALEGLGID